MSVLPSEAARAEGSVDLESFVNGRIEAGSRNLYAETLEVMERHLLARVEEVGLVHSQDARHGVRIGSEP